MQKRAIFAHSLEVGDFYILEIADGADLELEGRVLVADDDALPVELEAADRPHVVDAFLDGMPQSPGLVLAVGQHHDFPCVHDGADAHGESCGWHLGGIVVEKSSVGDFRIHGERLYAGAGGEGGTGLVEGDMAVGTYATHEEIDAVRFLDFILVGGAFGYKIGSHPVEYMNVLGGNIYMREEVIPHESVIALLMFLRQTDVLIHIERDDIREGNQFRAVHFDESAIHAKGRRSRGQPQHEWTTGGSSVYLGRDVIRRPFGHTGAVPLNDDSHRCLLSPLAQK